jgi:hypothetical protein
LDPAGQLASDVQVSFASVQAKDAAASAAMMSE